MSKFDKIRERLKKFTSERRGGKGFVAKSPSKKDKQTTKKDKDDKEQKTDQPKKEEKKEVNLNVGAGTGGRQTSDFIEDLKDAYKT